MKPRACWVMGSEREIRFRGSGIRASGGGGGGGSAEAGSVGVRRPERRRRMDGKTESVYGLTAGSKPSNQLPFGPHGSKRKIRKTSQKIDLSSLI